MIRPAKPGGPTSVGFPDPIPGILHPVAPSWHEAFSTPLLLSEPGGEQRDHMDHSPKLPLEFAPDHDSPIAYMRRTREYYAAIGYTTPYRWAHYVAAPFTPLPKSLPQCKVALIT